MTQNPTGEHLAKFWLWKEKIINFTRWNLALFVQWRSLPNQKNEVEESGGLCVVTVTGLMSPLGIIF